MSNIAKLTKKLIKELSVLVNTLALVFLGMPLPGAFAEDAKAIKARAQLKVNLEKAIDGKAQEVLQSYKENPVVDLDNFPYFKFGNGNKIVPAYFKLPTNSNPSSYGSNTLKRCQMVFGLNNWNQYRKFSYDGGPFGGKAEEIWFQNLWLPVLKKSLESYSDSTGDGDSLWDRAFSFSTSLFNLGQSGSNEAGPDLTLVQAAAVLSAIPVMNFQRECALHMALSSNSDTLEPVASYTSNDKVLECTSNGVETQDYDACVNVINMYDAGVVAGMATVETQNIVEQKESQQAVAGMAGANDMLAGQKAQADFYGRRTNYSNQRAAVGTAKFAALMGARMSMDTRDSLIARVANIVGSAENYYKSDDDTTNVDAVFIGLKSYNTYLKTISDFLSQSQSSSTGAFMNPTKTRVHNIANIITSFLLAKAQAKDNTGITGLEEAIANLKDSTATQKIETVQKANDIIQSAQAEVIQLGVKNLTESNVIDQIKGSNPSLDAIFEIAAQYVMTDLVGRVTQHVDSGKFFFLMNQAVLDKTKGILAMNLGETFANLASAAMYQDIKDDLKAGINKAENYVSKKGGESFNDDFLVPLCLGNPSLPECANVNTNNLNNGGGNFAGTSGFTFGGPGGFQTTSGGNAGDLDSPTSPQGALKANGIDTASGLGINGQFGSAKADKSTGFADPRIGAAVKQASGPAQVAAGGGAAAPGGAAPSLGRAQSNGSSRGSKGATGASRSGRYAKSSASATYSSGGQRGSSRGKKGGSNPFSSMFGKKGAKGQKGKSLRFMASNNKVFGGSTNIWSRISKRYAVVKKDKRLLEYKLK